MGAFEMMADHRCTQQICSTCDLFLAIPEMGTPAYEVWRGSILADLLTDPRVLSYAPDLVLWLLDQRRRSDDGNN